MQQILITGTSRGIGLEMVRQYAQRGDAHIFATCRHPDSAEELRQIAKQHPEQVTIVRLDVASQASIEDAVKQIAAQTDHLDILINNAGINPPGIQSLNAITKETMLHVFEVNAAAPLMLVKSCVDLLKNGSHARVINVSSQVGSMEWKKGGGSYAYAASKAALNMVTRCLAVDLRSYGVTTITIHPGWVQTDMGGAGASLKPEAAVRDILKLIDRLSPRDNGNFYKWNGDPHPW